MLEMVSLGWFRFGLDTLKDLWRYIRRNKRDLTPAKRLELRQKWREKFEEFFWVNTHKKLSTGVIIRDMARLDDYPDVNEKGMKGISPWFRTSLLQTYQRGFMVSLAIGELVRLEGENRWRYRDWIKREDGEKFWRVGFIPYENIVDVNWDGDKYYNYPHVFCHFDGQRKQPYERVVYCQKFEVDSVPHFREVLESEAAHKTSKKFGLKYFR